MGSKKKFWFRKEMGWEETGFLTGWLTNRTFSNHIVSAKSMGNFKRKLDKFMDEDVWLEIKIMIDNCSGMVKTTSPLHRDWSYWRAVGFWNC